MYNGETIDVAETLAELERAAQRAGFQVEVFGEVAALPLLGLTRPGPSGAPRIYLSAGVHGDEPAPPAAVLSLLETDALSREKAWTIVPLLNPTGLLANTRENAEGIDLNRDYALGQTAEVRAHRAWLAGRQFDLAVCLHEDWEAQGFYVYEVLPDKPARRPAEAVLAAVEKIAPIENGTEIDGFAAQGGIIHPPAEAREPDRTDLPEALYLHFHYAPLGLTFETPSNALPLRERVACHVAGVQALP